MSGRIETTFRGYVEGLKHKRPETAGTPPKTSITIDCEALDAEVAAKLFQLEHGHPVQVTIADVQERMDLEPPQPAVPGGFHVLDQDQLDPDTRDHPPQRSTKGR